MIYVELTPDGEHIALTHYAPFDKVHGLGRTREELEKSGILVSELPSIEDQEGKVPTLRYNKETKAFYYEYTDRPLTFNEEILQLKSENAQMLYALMMGGLI